MREVRQVGTAALADCDVLLLNCPHCGNGLTLRKELIGKVGDCLWCHFPVVGIISRATGRPILIESRGTPLPVGACSPEKASSPPAQPSVSVAEHHDMPIETRRSFRPKVSLEWWDPEGQNGEEGAVSFDEFPITIGRHSRDGSANRDQGHYYFVDDQPPYQASRRHCRIEMGVGGLEIIDGNSNLGTIVDGQKIGLAADSKRLPLPAGEHLIVLGNAHSRIRFRLRVEYLPFR